MRIRFEALLRALAIIFLSVSIASLIPACGPKPKVEDSCNFTQNVYGERLSWKNNLPVPLYVHQSFPSQYLPALYSAIEVWDKAIGKKTFQIVSESMPGPLDPREDRKSVIYWMDHWDENASDEQGRTTVYNIGNEIVEADIGINASHATSGSETQGFNFYLDSPTRKTDIHLESLLIHELGHVLGLKHNDDGTSVMDTHLAENSKRVVLSSSDIDSLRCEY